jgi:L-aspartate oxidase
LRKTLQEAANRRLLIIREEDGLNRFIEVCDDIKRTLCEDTRIASVSDLIQSVELENMIDVGRMMATAALARRESRGSHYREDYPARDDAQAENIIISAGEPAGFLRARLGEL